MQEGRQNISETRKISSQDTESSSPCQLTQTERAIFSVLETGVFRGAIPERCGGEAWESERLLDLYRSVATQDLSAALIVSQRNSAISWIAAAQSSVFTDELLEQGLKSFVTTQAMSYLAPSARTDVPVIATKRDGGYVLSGRAPWASGVSLSDYLVMGAAVKESPERIVVAADLRSTGISQQEHVGLHALQRSDSCVVKLEEFFVPSQQVLLGPDPNVFQMTTSGEPRLYPPLQTSALAIGHADRCIERIEQGGRITSELEPILETLFTERADVEQLLHAVRRREFGDQTADQNVELRARCNALAIRSAEVALSVAGGSGFFQAAVESQLMSESVFFLVWACSPQVRQRTLELLAPCEHAG